MLVKELAGFRQDKELKVGWDEALLGNPELHYLEHLLLVPSAAFVGVKLPDRLFLFGLLWPRHPHGTLILWCCEEFSVSTNCSLVDAEFFSEGAVRPVGVDQ